MRLLPYLIVENLATSATTQERTEWFNCLSGEQSKAVRAHAALMLEEYRLTQEDAE